MTAGGTDATALTVVNALLLTMADGAEPFRGWLTVGDDGTITGIGPGDPPTPPSTVDPSASATSRAVLDVGGAIVAPGFISAHSHLFMSGLRGLGVGETLYGWLAENMAVLTGAGVEDLYWFTLHGSLDFARNGITSAFNFAQSRVIWNYDPQVGSASLGKVHPVDFLTRQVDAGADAGIRVMSAIRLDDEAFPEQQVLDTFAAVADHIEANVPAPLNLGAAIFGAVQWAATSRTAAVEAELMRRHGVINQAHFVETAEALEQQQAKFAWYDEAGILGPRFLFGHFVHPTDEMITRAAAAGAGMVWQPTSNGRLGSGIADIPRLRAAGIRIGVGLDDQSCTDISDPFQNMRIGIYTLRALHSDAKVLMPAEMLRMHTLGSAEVLGVADRLGSLEVGKHADFLVVDPREPDTGPIWDVYATYVFACGLRNLKQVYVGGKPVYDAAQPPSELTLAATTELHARVAHAARAAGVTPGPLTF
ncbi:amidohydrolase family protein [Pseudofrankia inefficax]|uniref:Amidohydrolase n=1 Tax=Pseudofrankia inefficax (strain DSM 45817 / CECT 9037 / DDB 130130 / EuI1c) TaxID=298654 RepID=E3JB44_PSEI1|nr:amidohydrolase family protein [Pseudofrankia inefficax]ADP84665.1 amidohydrolase [Pseudofrankia inefficax]